MRAVTRLRRPVKAAETGAVMLCMLGFCLVLTSGICAAQAQEKENAAVAAAKQWLALVDEGEYGESWTRAAGYFKNAVTQEKWEQSLSGARKPLGKLISREVKDKMYETALPGAPDGEYVIIHFQTSFDNKKSATETVTPMLEKDGQWRVSGYFIK